MAKIQEQKFSRFLIVSLVTFQVVSLTLVIGVLYGTLSRSLEREFQNKLRFRQQETSMILWERIRLLETNLLQLSLINSLRVSLMLGMENQLTDILKQYNQNPLLEGAFFFIEDVESVKYIPKFTEQFKIMRPWLENIDPNRRSKQYKFTKVSEKSCMIGFSAKIMKKDTLLGNVLAMYDISKDRNLWSLFDKKPDAKLFFYKDGYLYDLKNETKIEYPESAIQNREFNVRQEFSLIPLDHFPGFFYADSTKTLIQQKKALIVTISLICTTIFILTFLFAIYLIHKITQPLENMADQALNIAHAPSEHNLQEEEIRYTEFRKLARAFNKVLAGFLDASEKMRKFNQELEDRVLRRTKQLEDAQKQLIDASRQAGMSEVATGVLHNIGNVLNSVNVAANMTAEKISDMRITGFHMAVSLLKEHEDDLSNFFSKDAKGKQLPDYLDRLAQLMEDQQNIILSEIDVLLKHISHIKDIVSTQQDYASMAGLSENINVKQIVEDAISLNKGTLNRHEIRVLTEYHKVPDIVSEKHRILQILMNLLQNAKHAFDGVDRIDKELNISVKPSPEEGFVEIHIKDNGQGIPPENLVKIFSYGFTTKEKGHGFGLHISALSAEELKGKLTVKSDGTGKGATFILRLPLHKRKAG